MLDRALDHRALGGLAWAVVALLLPNVALRVVAHDVLWPSIVLNMVTAYLYLPAYPALAVAVRQRRRLLGAVAATIVVAHLVWTGEVLIRADAPPASSASASRSMPAPFRVFSANVMAWSDVTDGIVEEIRRADADLVVLQELSPIWAAALGSGEMLGAYPHRIEVVRTDPRGSGIYARRPFIEADVLETPSMPVTRATVVVAGTQVRVYSVHALPPARAEWVGEWSRGLAAIEEAAAREQLPVILAGDFNATPQSAWHRSFRARGFRDAHELCGRPFATTWPNGVLPIPPIRLDHVLVSARIGCTRIAEGVGEGSDHRPVIVDLYLVARRAGR